MLLTVNYLLIQQRQKLYLRSMATNSTHGVKPSQRDIKTLLCTLQKQHIRKNYKRIIVYA